MGMNPPFSGTHKHIIRRWRSPDTKWRKVQLLTLMLMLQWRKYPMPLSSSPPSYRWCASCRSWVMCSSSYLRRDRSWICVGKWEIIYQSAKKRDHYALCYHRHHQHHHHHHHQHPPHPHPHHHHHPHPPPPRHHPHPPPRHHPHPPPPRHHQYHHHHHQ